MKKHRVVVTGIGMCSPIAADYIAFQEALLAGVSGARPISLFDASAFPTTFAAEVEWFDAARALDWAVRLCPTLEIAIPPAEDRKTAFGVYAAMQAMREATRGVDDPLPPSTSLHLGTGLSSVSLEQLEDETLPWIDDQGRLDTVAFGRSPDGAAARNRSAPWRHLTDEANRIIGTALGLRGASSSNFGACAASLHALGRAFRDVQSGLSDVALAGGMDSMIHPFGMISFMKLGALSSRNDSPETASRPFDRNRDGFLLGEGGAVLVLEELDRARDRGARIYAEIVGYGTSIDAHMVTAPHPEGRGAQLAMQRALRDADLQPSAIDYINAHGTGTTLNDSIESAAIRKVFGDETPPVSSTKSMTGHLIAAAGAVEAVACIAAIERGFLPPSINIEDLDPACDVPVVSSDRGVEADVRVAMTNSFGFGGQNGVAIVARYEGD